MKVRIADLNIELLGADYEYISTRMQSYIYDFEKADITLNCVVTEEEIELPDYAFTEKIERWNWITEKSGSVSVFNVETASKKVSCLIEWNEKFDRADICFNDSCPITDFPTEKKLFNILGMVMGYTVIKFNGMIFHSSAISYKNEALLFSAPSGTGKSTHTLMWKEMFPEDVEIFNDDTPVIRKTEKGLYAYGTPWSGKTAINLPVKIPLKAIVCIARGKENKISRLSKRDAFFRIFNETKKPAEMKWMGESIDFITFLAENTEVYELFCNISEEAVLTVKKEIFK